MSTSGLHTCVHTQTQISQTRVTTYTYHIHAHIQTHAEMRKVGLAMQLCLKLTVLLSVEIMGAHHHTWPEFSFVGRWGIEEQFIERSGMTTWVSMLHGQQSSGLTRSSP